MNKLLKDRLKLLIAQSGRTAREISIKATGKPDTLRDIITRDKAQNPRADTLAAIAKELNVDLRYLTGERITQGRGEASPFLAFARVIHVVQAGPFIPLDMQIDEDLDPIRIPTVQDPDLPGLEPLAFLVKGDSVDRICPQGGYAIGINFADTGLAIQSRMWVIAERIRGDLVERTVKMVKLERGKFELHPFSHNPAHKPIKFPSAERSEEVRIFALVRRFETGILHW